ncbi:MAG: EF-hand domain-containing protein [Novosphingobium sp.]
MNKLTLAISAAALAFAGAGFAAYAAEADGHHMMDPMGAKTVTRAEALAHAAAMFDKLDANHDGKLDTADREARQIARFKKIDTDGNGAISQTEFPAAHARKLGDHGMGHDRGGDGMKDHGRMGHEGRREMPMMGMVMLKMADTNKDGAVSRDEFVSAAMAHFDQADANHDGKVTPEERRAAMMAMHDRMKGMRGMGGMHEGPMPPSPSN